MKAVFSTNFGDVAAAGVSAALKFALDSERSDFYRKKYGGLDFGEMRSYEDLLRLPFLERGELLSTGWRDRLFVPDGNLAFAVSSGTSGSPRPLIIPHFAGEAQDIKDQAAEAASAGASGLMVLLPATHTVNLNSFLAQAPGCRIFPGDYKNIGASAAVAAELGLDAFMTTASALAKLAEAFQAGNLDRGKVRWVSLGGEGCSRLKYAWLRSKFPDARFSMRYGAVEFANLRFRRCPRLSDDPALFHPAGDSHVFEIISPSGDPLPPGTEGELVHTDAAAPRPFPFIRYRTGDAATLLPGGPCACGAACTLRLPGKIGFDSFKYAGTALNADMVFAALDRLGGAVERDFRLVVSETETDGRILPSLELRLVPAGARKLGPAREELEDRLAGLAAAAIYLSRGSTLAQLTAAGEFAPLKVRLVDAFPPETGKTRRIISLL